MSIFEWVLVISVALFFLIVMFYSLGDLFRDWGFYKKRQKNVTFLSRKKTKKTKQSSKSINYQKK